MKKILIVNNNMHIGGVQKALINLLWNIHEKYDITLFLFYNGGAYLDDIPEDINIIHADSAYRFLGMTKYDVDKNFKDKIGRCFFALISRIFGRKVAVYFMSFSQKKIVGYDVAISYLHNGGEKVFYGGCNEFVLRHVSAEKKIAFLHCDYTLSGADNISNAKQYSKFDIIAACSDGCAQSFLEKNPLLKSKVAIVYNCHRFFEIKEDSTKKIVKMSSEFLNIVTVSRLGKEKGVCRAVRAIAGLDEIKNSVKYYIIGDGIERDDLKKVIEESHLSQNVVLCGELKNPYPYIKAADVLLIPSHSEAAPIVIGEAVCLGTPVLSTETSSAKELIELKELGWVCENSEQGIQDAINWIYDNKYKIEEKKQYLKKQQFDNNEALKQFDKMIYS